jgi:hypothetical protein
MLPVGPAWLTSCATQAIALQGGAGGLKHALCGGGRRWRPRWPRGRRFRWPWRQHGATLSGYRGA